MARERRRRQPKKPDPHAEWIERVGEEHGGLLKMDGYDDCIIGTTTQFNKTLFLYDREKVIAKLMREGPMSREDAVEFHEFNQAGAWVGDTTPAFFDPPDVQ